MNKKKKSKKRIGKVNPVLYAIVYAALKRKYTKKYNKVAICLHFLIVNKAGIKKSFWGYSLAIQCLELGTFTAGDWVQSLVRELGFTNCVVWFKKKSHSAQEL